MGISISIVGLGVVGGACRFGFLKNGHDVTTYDTNPELGCDGEDDWVRVLETEICYVCVPTPANEDGSCNTSIVESVVDDLADSGYRGVVAIKSTVPPGTTKRIIERHTVSPKSFFKDMVFVPETLRERCATTDFVELHKILVVGCTNKDTFELVKECHGDFPWETMMVTPTEAELFKYYHNSFAALRVVFANQFYDLCEAIGDVDYNKVKKATLKAGSLPDRYFDVNKNCRGYKSPCLSKDPEAIVKLATDLGVDLSVLSEAISANGGYDQTPFAGTRG